jgi:hypothetical protein
VPGTGAFPELVEASGEAGEGGIEVLADLAADQGHLEDEIATMANKELQGLPCFIKRALDQGEAVDSGPVDGRQVGVVGFVTGITGLAELFGGEGMDNANFEAGGGDGLLHRTVIAAGAFHGHQEVVKCVLR